MAPTMRITGVDRFSRSVLVRLIVVTGWFVISMMAFFSRYDRWTPALATLMIAGIVGIFAFGLSWAAWPGVTDGRGRGVFTPRSRPLPEPLAWTIHKRRGVLRGRAARRAVPRLRTRPLRRRPLSPASRHATPTQEPWQRSDPGPSGSPPGH